MIELLVGIPLSPQAAMSAERISFSEARQALYIDFESLATTPPHPALLGILVGSDQDTIEHIVTDKRLAPASVARPTCRVQPLGDAVADLVARARGEERLLVGWSLFDRDRLIDARPDLAADVRALYRNALRTARPWRKKIYPRFPIERADDYAPKHTLDQYAALARYPNVAALRDAEPAKWIRHVLAQLEATDGRYRRVTQETKGDWHKLLHYNEHDCRALRHIVVKAARELECWSTYERTRFCVDADRRQICMSPGARSPALDRLLDRYGTDRVGLHHGLEPWVSATFP